MGFILFHEEAIKFVLRISKSFSVLELGKPNLDSKPYGSFFEYGALGSSW
jgi:hypothetical protein